MRKKTEKKCGWSELSDLRGGKRLAVVLIGMKRMGKTKSASSPDGTQKKKV